MNNASKGRDSVILLILSDSNFPKSSLLTVQITYLDLDGFASVSCTLLGGRAATGASAGGKDSSLASDS